MSAGNSSSSGHSPVKWASLRRANSTATASFVSSRADPSSKTTRSRRPMGPSFLLCPAVFLPVIRRESIDSGQHEYGQMAKIRHISYADVPHSAYEASMKADTDQSIDAVSGASDGFRRALE